MKSVDTNVLVRLITRDDPRQADAAEAFIERGAWVSTLALTEAMWVLEAVYERKPPELATALDMLLNHRNLIVQDSDVVAGALELFRAKPSLGFSDCLMLHISRKAGHVPLGTFDRSLAKVEGAARI